jgi:hypothetical protein
MPTLQMKRDAVELMKAGMLDRAISEKLHINLNTVQTWRRDERRAGRLDPGRSKIGKAPPPVTPPAPGPGPAPVKVEAVRVPDGGGEPPRGGGGYEAARNYAGVGKSDGGAGSVDGGAGRVGDTPGAGPGAPAATPGSPPMPAGEALVVLADAITMGITRVQCARLHVALDDALGARLKLSPADKAVLRTAAPWAERPFDELLQKYGDRIGLGLFALLFWSVLTDKLALVKSLAPKKEEDKKEGKK